MESDNDENDDWEKPVEFGNHDKSNSVCTSSSFKTKDSHNRVIIHIDIDCFYAQVEMLRNPELRDKPLGVQQKYIIVTCNYPARKYGLTKCMLVKEAMEKCPDLILVSGEDLTNYRKMSYKISEYLQTFCPLVERLGFDENFMDVTDLVYERCKQGASGQDLKVKGHIFQDGADEACVCGCHERLTVGSHIAFDIREGLYANLGITCCAGIAHNKLLSKLVAGTHKPNQQTTLFPQQMSTLLNQLESIRNIPGIGWAMEKCLNNLGILSVKDLLNADPVLLEKECGSVAADKMKKLCLGIDEQPVIAFGLPQTLSDEDSFKMCSTYDDAKHRIRQLLRSLLTRWTEDGRIPHTFRLSIRRFLETVRYNNRESRQSAVSPSIFAKVLSGNVTYALEQLENIASSLFTKMVDVTQPFHITLINVAFAKLEQKTSDDANIANFFSLKATDSLKRISNSSLKDTDKQTSVVAYATANTSKIKPQSGLHRWFSSSPYSDRETNCHTSEMGSAVKTIQKYGIKCKHDVQSSFDVNIPEQSGTNDYKTCNLVKNFVGNNEWISSSEKNSVKRFLKASPKGDTEPKYKKAKKTYINAGVAESSIVVLEDIDKSVFDQLPVDIREEIMENMKQTATNKNEASVDADLQRNILGQTCSFFESDSVVKKDHLKKQPVSEVKEPPLQSHCSRTLKFTSGEMSASGYSNRNDGLVPPNIDKDVFFSLPAEIQTELITEWQKNNDQKTKNYQKTGNNEQTGNDQKTGNYEETRNNQKTGNVYSLHIKTPKQSSNNILSYFSKK